MKRSSSTCRQRKVICPTCGNTARQTRSWMAKGLLTCCCGDQLRPESPADLAFIGLIGPEDMGQADWNAIARENGWPLVYNQGQMAKAIKRGETIDTELLGAPGKPQCSYAGCGRWTRGGAEYCHEHAPALEPAIPF